MWNSCERDVHLIDPPVHEVRQLANQDSIKRFVGFDDERDEAPCTWEGYHSQLATLVPKHVL
jgi:hypothetical protein